MSRKERLLVNAIDVEQEYKVIGLDLAKNDTSCVCIADSGEIIATDRLSYSDLLETAKQLSLPPFLIWSRVMECTGLLTNCRTMGMNAGLSVEVWFNSMSNHISENKRQT